MATANNTIKLTLIMMCFYLYSSHNIVYSQSKKNQIITLNKSLDSTKVVIDSLKESYAKNLDILTNTLESNNRRIVNLESELAGTKMKLSESETDLRDVKDELATSLEQLAALKSKENFSKNTELIIHTKQYDDLKIKKTKVDNFPYKNTERIAYEDYEDGFYIRKNKQGKILMAYHDYVGGDSFSRYEYYFDENGKTYAISYFHHDYFGSHNCGEKFERTKIEYYNQNFEVIGVENSIKTPSSDNDRNDYCNLQDDFFTKSFNSSIKNINTFLRQYNIAD